MRTEDELSLPIAHSYGEVKPVKKYALVGIMAAIMTLLMSVVAFADTCLVK